MLHGAHHSFGLGEWDIGPISLSPSSVNRICKEGNQDADNMAKFSLFVG